MRGGENKSNAVSLSVYGLPNKNLMVTTNQKSISYTQKRKKGFKYYRQSSNYKRRKEKNKDL